jgi:hypothetical protein
MGRDDKKKRHAAKRAAKKKDARRREGGSPMKRLADAPGEVVCWLSDGMDRFGQMQMFVYKRAGGMTGLSCFLVDRGVVGLKDAWSRIGLEAGELDEMLGTCREQGFVMRKGTVEEVRAWVAGGLRWASEHGMRLPKDWEKVALLIGGAGEWKSSDVSQFEKEFAGHPDDLRQRLVGEPLESFLERQDIEFVFDEGAPFMDQETGKYVHVDGEDEEPSAQDWEDAAKVVGAMPAEELESMSKEARVLARQLAAATIAWLESVDEEPSGELEEAWLATITGAAMTEISGLRAEDPAEASSLAYAVTLTLGKRLGSERQDEFRWGVDQLAGHMQEDPEVVTAMMMGGGRPEVGEWPGATEWKPKDIW